MAELRSGLASFGEALWGNLFGSTRLRLEPPEAPKRKPAEPTLEVPPLALPMSPSARRSPVPKSSLSARSSSTKDECSGDGLQDESDFDTEYENYEECIFSFSTEGDEALPKGFDFECPDPTLASCATSETSERSALQDSPSSETVGVPRMRSRSVCSPVGASPTLLSVLEKVAADEREGRGRSGSL